MTECYDIGKEKTNFALIAGSLHLLFAALQGVAATGFVDIPLVPGNAMGVFVLTVLGLVFIFGYRELEQGIPEGVSFIVVGIMLSLIFGVLYLLVLGADAVSAYVVKAENFEDWTVMDGIRPEIYLSLISLYGYLRWKDEFSSVEIPLPGGTTSPPATESNDEVTPSQEAIDEEREPIPELEMGDDEGEVIS